MMGADETGDTRLSLEQRAIARLQQLLESGVVGDIGHGLGTIYDVVDQWWLSSDADGQAAISSAVQALLLDHVRRQEFDDAHLLKEPWCERVLDLTQIAIRLELDKRVGAILWSIALLGRALSETRPLLPVRAERFLLSKLAVFEMPDFLPTWERFWTSNHVDLWGIASDAIANVDATRAAGNIPTLLERLDQLGQDSVRLRLNRLLQDDRVNWDRAIEAWIIKTLNDQGETEERIRLLVGAIQASMSRRTDQV